MKEIKLTGKRGGVALVDDEWFEELSKRRWYLNDGGYAATQINGKMTRMHRLIMGAKKGEQVDHRNRIRLDCQTSNLRIVTHAQNCQNAGKKTKNPTSPYKGVSSFAGARGWKAQIQMNGTTKHLGTFHSEKDAANCYDFHARKLFGEFALLNFPDENINPPVVRIRTPRFGFVGVIQRENGRFRASIMVNRKKICLGTYETPMEAGLAYNVGARKYKGDKAILNKIAFY